MRTTGVPHLGGLDSFQVLSEQRHCLPSLFDSGSIILAAYDVHVADDNMHWDVPACLHIEL